MTKYLFMRIEPTCPNVLFTFFYCVRRLLVAEDIERLHKALVLLQTHRHYLGPIATVERILLTATEKRRVATESGALAADMESAGIASVAAGQAVPFLAIRAILDPLEEELKIAFDQFLDKMGEPIPRLLARYLLAHPFALPKLVGLGLRTRLICATLGRLLRELIAIRF